MLNKHKLWENLIFSSTGSLSGYEFLTNVLDAFADKAELHETPEHMPKAQHIIQMILVSQFAGVLRHAFDKAHGVNHSSFEDFLAFTLREEMREVPDKILREVEECVYDELHDQEIPVVWSKHVIGKKEDHPDVRCHCSLCESRRS